VRLFLWGVALAQAPVVVEVDPAGPTWEQDVAGEVTAADAALAAGDFVDAGRRFQALADAARSAELWRRAAMAWFEAGQLDLADRAVAAGLVVDPRLPGLRLVEGALRTEQGRAADADAALAAAIAGAPDDPQLQAAARYDRGLSALERGDFDRARADLADAAAWAARAGDGALAERVAEQVGRIAAMSAPVTSTDDLGRVADALSRGDLTAARAALPRPSAADRRGQIRQQIGEAAIARAEGRLDAAIASLAQAIAIAREAGLVREHAAALAELGVTYAAGGQFDLARSPLESAVARVDGTSFRLAAASYHASAGVVCARLGDTAGAERHLAAGRAALGATADLATRARLGELEGGLAAASGDLGRAQTAFAAAAASFDALHAWEDSARVAISEIEAYAGRDDAAAAAAARRAEVAFARSNNPLATARIAMARAVGASRAGDGPGAMTALAAAVTAAEAVPGGRGARFAAVAQDRARALLASASGDPAIRERAAALGFAQVVATFGAHADASRAFEAGTAAYNARRYADAERAFALARTSFQAAGEASWEREARRNQAWSAYNGAISAAPAAQVRAWDATAAEGAALSEPELEARSRAGAAIAAAGLGAADARQRLLDAARLAQRIGLATLAGRCHARRSEIETDLREIVGAADLAWALTGDTDEGRYAVYQAAVKAYQADQYALAVSLAERIDDVNWSLRSGVMEVRDAARQMLAE
jgi:tetratricopeptide (TPR) repeat protein